MQQRPPPEAAGRAIDKKQLSRLVNQQVAPLQIIVGEMMVMQGTGVLRQLLTDTCNPVWIGKPSISMTGHLSHITCVFQLTRH